MIQDEEKFKALRDTLRSLPRLKAKKDFEARLMQRISEANIPVLKVTGIVKTATTEKSWFANLFRPAFVPALGLTVILLITVVVYFAYFSKLNNGSPDNTQQFVSSTNQGELIIYVKKDVDDLSGNYPKEYSAVNPDDNRSTEFFAPSVETPSDYFAKPDPTNPSTPELKPDRISEEQRIEMQRFVEPDRDKGVDTKSDDGIMKKESKSDSKIETKGEMKSETKKSEKKSSDEKKNIFIDEDNDTNQEQKLIPPPPVPKKDESKANDNINQQTDDESENRIGRATKKDSTKIKSDSEADEKKIEQK